MNVIASRHGSLEISMRTRQKALVQGKFYLTVVRLASMNAVINSNISPCFHPKQYLYIQSNPIPLSHPIQSKPAPLPIVFPHAEPLSPFPFQFFVTTSIHRLICSVTSPLASLYCRLRK